MSKPQRSGRNYRKSAQGNKIFGKLEHSGKFWFNLKIAGLLVDQKSHRMGFGRLQTAHPGARPYFTRHLASPSEFFLRSSVSFSAEGVFNPVGYRRVTRSRDRNDKKRRCRAKQAAVEQDGLIQMTDSLLRYLIRGDADPFICVKTP